MFREIDYSYHMYEDSTHFSLENLSLITALDFQHLTCNYDTGADDFETYMYNNQPFHSNIAIVSSTLHNNYSDKLITINDFDWSYGWSGTKLSTSDSESVVDNVCPRYFLGNGFHVLDSPWSSRDAPYYLANIQNNGTVHKCSNYECGNIILPGYPYDSYYGSTAYTTVWFLVLVDYVYFKRPYTHYYYLISFSFRCKQYNDGSGMVNYLVNNGCFINPYATLNDVSGITWNTAAGRNVIVGSYNIFWAGYNGDPTNLLSSPKTGSLQYKGKQNNKQWYGSASMTLNIPKKGSKQFSVIFMGGIPDNAIRNRVQL